MNKPLSLDRMVRRLEVYLPEAIEEMKVTHVIDGIYKYEISHYIKINQDIFVTISLYHFEGGELNLFLSGINEDGVIDVIDVAPATKKGLARLLKQMNTIEKRGSYIRANEWALTGTV